MKLATPEYIVSACLAGETCRWNGVTEANPAILELVRQGKAVAFCPEVLGGLAVPRYRSEIRGGDGNDVLSGKAKVINAQNQDVTGEFLLGAKKFLSQAKKFGVGRALMKENSPSCGVKKTYMNGKLTGGRGVTTALLLKQGFEVKGLA